MKARAGVATVAGLLVLGAGGFLVYQRTGPAPQLPAYLEELDPLVQELLLHENARVGHRRRSPDAWVRLGMVSEANDLFGTAADAYQRALELRAGDARSLHRLACVQERIGDLTLAAATMQRAAEAQPDFAASWWRLAGWRLDLGDLPAAEQALEGARQLEPEALPVLVLHARLNLARGDSEQALRYLGDAGLLQHPSLGPYAHHLLAIALRETGDLEGAQRAHARSDGKRPSYSDPWALEMRRWRTGYAAMRLQAGRDLSAGRYAQAEELLQQILERDPADVQALNMMGACRLRQNDVRSAVASFEEALRLRPGHRGSLFNLAQALLRPGSAGREALEPMGARLRTRLEQDPEDADGWRILAQVEVALGRGAESLAALDRWAALAPNPLEARLQAADSARRMQRFADALERYRTLQREHPDSGQAWVGEVAVLVQAGRAQEAREALDVLAARGDVDAAELERLRAALSSMR